MQILGLGKGKEKIQKKKTNAELNMYSKLNEMNAL